MNQYCQGGCKGVGPGQTFPHFPFLAREWSMPEGGRELRERRSGGLGLRASQRPRVPRLPPPWTTVSNGGGVNGESLNCRRGKRPEHEQGDSSQRRPAENWEGVCTVLPAQVCAGRGAVGFPGEPGKPSQLDSGFPPASGLGCCKRHGSRWVLKPTLQLVGSPCPPPPTPTRLAGVALRTDGGKLIHWKKSGGI